MSGTELGHLACLHEEALKDITAPVNLNSGELEDVYKLQISDFDDPETLEVTYDDGQGRRVKEIVFVDPVFADRRPRICVSVEGIQAMHAAISTLTRKVDNLILTLTSCRSAYYKDLTSLKEQLTQQALAAEAGKQYSVTATTMFDPKAFNSLLTEELDQKVMEKTRELTQRLLEQEAENQRLKKRVAITDQEKNRIMQTQAKKQDVREICADLVSSVNMDTLIRTLGRVAQDEEQVINAVEEYVGEKKGVKVREALAAAAEDAAKLKQMELDFGKAKQDLESQRKEHEKLSKALKEVQANLLKSEATAKELQDSYEEAQSEAQEHKDEVAKLSKEPKFLREQMADMQKSHQSELEKMRQLLQDVHKDFKMVHEPGTENFGGSARFMDAPWQVSGAVQKMSPKDQIEAAETIFKNLSEDAQVTLAAPIWKAIKNLARPAYLEVMLADTRALGPAKVRVDCIKKFVDQLPEEDLNLVTPVLPPTIAKDAAIKALESSVAEEGSSEKEKVDLVAINPYTDLSKPCRKHLVYRTVMKMPAAEAKDFIVELIDDLGQKAKKAVLVGIFEDQDPLELKTCAEQIYADQSIKAFVNGLSDKAVQRFLVETSGRMDREQALELVRTGKSSGGVKSEVVAEGRESVKVQTDLSSVNRALVPVRRVDRKSVRKYVQDSKEAAEEEYAEGKSYTSFRTSMGPGGIIRDNSLLNDETGQGDQESSADGDFDDEDDDFEAADAACQTMVFMDAERLDLDVENEGPPELKQALEMEFSNLATPWLSRFQLSLAGDDGALHKALELYDISSLKSFMDQSVKHVMSRSIGGVNRQETDTSEADDTFMTALEVMKQSDGPLRKAALEAEDSLTQIQEAAEEAQQARQAYRLVEQQRSDGQALHISDMKTKKTISEDSPGMTPSTSSASLPVNYGMLASSSTTSLVDLKAWQEKSTLPENEEQVQGSYDLEHDRDPVHHDKGFEQDTESRVRGVQFIEERRGAQSLAEVAPELEDLIASLDLPPEMAIQQVKAFAPAFFGAAEDQQPLEAADVAKTPAHMAALLKSAKANKVKSAISAMNALNQSQTTAPAAQAAGAQDAAQQQAQSSGPRSGAALLRGASGKLKMASALLGAAAEPAKQSPAAEPQTFAFSSPVALPEAPVAKSPGGAKLTAFKSRAAEVLAGKSGDLTSPGRRMKKAGAPSAAADGLLDGNVKTVSLGFDFGGPPAPTTPAPKKDPAKPVVLDLSSGLGGGASSTLGQLKKTVKMTKMLKDKAAQAQQASKAIVAERAAEAEKLVLGQEPRAEQEAEVIGAETDKPEVSGSQADRLQAIAAKAAASAMSPRKPPGKLTAMQGIASPKRRMLEAAGKRSGDGKAFTDALPEPRGRSALPGGPPNSKETEDKDELPGLMDMLRSQGMKPATGLGMKPPTPMEDEDEINAPRGLPSVKTPRPVEKPKAENQVVPLPGLASTGAAKPDEMILLKGEHVGPEVAKIEVKASDHQAVQDTSPQPSAEEDVEAEDQVVPPPGAAELDEMILLKGEHVGPEVAKIEVKASDHQAVQDTSPQPSAEEDVELRVGSAPRSRQVSAGSNPGTAASKPGTAGAAMLPPPLAGTLESFSQHEGAAGAALALTGENARPQPVNEPGSTGQSFSSDTLRHEPEQATTLRHEPEQASGQPHRPLAAANRDSSPDEPPPVLQAARPRNANRAARSSIDATGRGRALIRPAEGGLDSEVENPQQQPLSLRVGRAQDETDDMALPVQESPQRVKKKQPHQAKARSASKVINDLELVGSSGMAATGMGSTGMATNSSGHTSGQAWNATPPESMAPPRKSFNSSSPEIKAVRLSAQFSPDVGLKLVGHGQEDAKASSASPTLSNKLPLGRGSHIAAARNQSVPPPQLQAASPLEEDEKSASVPPKEGAARRSSARTSFVANVAAIGGVLSVSQAPQARRESQRDPSRGRASASGEMAATLALRVQDSLSKRYGSIDAAVIDMEVQINRFDQEDLPRVTSLTGTSTSSKEEGQAPSSDKKLTDLRTVLVQAGVSYKDATLLLQALTANGDAQGLALRDVVRALQPGELKQDAVDWATRNAFLGGDDPNINLGSLLGISNLDARTILEKQPSGSRASGLLSSRSRSGSPNSRLRTHL